MNQYPSYQPQRSPNFSYSTHQGSFKYPLYYINDTHRPIGTVKDGVGFYYIDYHPKLNSNAYRGSYYDSPICILQWNGNHSNDHPIYRLSAGFRGTIANTNISLAIHLYRYTDVIAAVPLFLQRGAFEETMPRIIKVEASINVCNKMAEIAINDQTYDQEYFAKVDKIRKEREAYFH
jgi:hypothetical protein